ncbi:hypothetical protein EW026_g4405 [Hermanssonia centrifuga]|uniref:Cyclase n=1 Tax=Hermanssonia centrifuga TaxID=98765 RepID=A0A4S4KH83_9APHY|nr:hypothetical protein EW026_g4405 [Hermanssonia centrifuga]
MADNKQLPTFDELPNFHEYTGCAWGVWGKDDQLGTINLLTEKVTGKDDMSELARELSRKGSPLFNRQPPVIQQWMKHETVNDDSIIINTQSGSQWDGLKHFGIAGHNVFYNNTPSESFYRGNLAITDPSKVSEDLIKLGIHNWAQHGICGRGVLLDLVKFYTDGGKPLPYDPWTTHAISLQDLEACAKAEGVTFRQGDILLLRIGFMQRYYSATPEERDALGSKPETFAGIEQGEDMKRFLWNNHFAAAASDQPALERWPTPEGTPHMHQTLLGLWGMPIGEFFDLELLSKTCAEAGRYTFFFSSWPLNV